MGYVFIGALAEAPQAWATMTNILRNAHVLSALRQIEIKVYDDGEREAPCVYAGRMKRLLLTRSVDKALEG